MKTETFHRVADYYSERTLYPLRSLKPGQIVVSPSHLRYPDVCAPPPRRCILWMAVLPDRAVVSTQYGLVDDVRRIVESVGDANGLLAEDVRRPLLSLCRERSPDHELRPYFGAKLYCDADMHEPIRDPNVRKLTRETAEEAVPAGACGGDANAVDYLLQDDAAFAYFLDEQQVAWAATHPVGAMSDRIGDVWVETLEAHRRRGYGKAVLSATTGALIGQGKVAVCGTGTQGQAGFRTPESIGYRLFCHEFSVRFPPIPDWTN